MQKEIGQKGTGIDKLRIKDEKRHAATVQKKTDKCEL